MMNFGDNERERNVCPSDRQLALRAKLQTGWSTGKAPTAALDAAEREAIIAVIQRNEELEISERQRVGRLVERVEKIKERAAECGPKNCRLCGQGFGLLGPSRVICNSCRKPVCSKCAIELSTRINGRMIWLCKICSETREMWKKTGAWFFKGIPRYELPSRNTEARYPAKELRSRPERISKLSMKVSDSSSDEDDIDAPDTNIQRRVGSLKINSETTGRNNFTSENVSVSTRKTSPLELFQFSRQTNTSGYHSGPNSTDWETESVSGSGSASKRDCNGASSSGSLIRCGSMSSSWSMSETSSGNSSTITGPTSHNQLYREPPLGWLEVSLLYSESDHALDCTMIRARDLPAMNRASTADPFCKLNIIPDTGVPKQQKWLVTKTVHKTRNPEFNETARFFGVEPEELSISTLYVVLLDDDKFGHDFLGVAKIPLGPIYSSGSHRMSIPLGSEDQQCIDASNSGPWPRGSIHLGLCYNTKKRSLIVQIKRCSNLMAKDKNGFSDPFVKLQLKPDSHRNKKHKTSIKWRTLHPVFNEEFSFETRPSELDKQSLVLTVWDKDISKPDDFLGSLLIGHNSKGRRWKQWKDCIRLPDHFHEQWHCLSSELNPH